MKPSIHSLYYFTTVQRGLPIAVEYTIVSPQRSVGYSGGVIILGLYFCKENDPTAHLPMSLIRKLTISGELDSIRASISSIEGI